MYMSDETAAKMHESGEEEASVAAALGKIDQIPCFTLSQIVKQFGRCEEIAQIAKSDNLKTLLPPHTAG
jgi:hypothetical protein